MSEYKCQNGDKIYVGGVYVWEFRGSIDNSAIVAVDGRSFTDQTGKIGLIENLLSELPRDEDGYYIWEGGAQPVPDGWVVEVKLDDEMIDAKAKAKVLHWKKDNNSSDIAAFRVISTGDKTNTPEQEDWCKVGAKVCIGDNPKLHEILKIDEDKGCFLGCGLWKCRTELRPATEKPHTAIVGKPALTGWQEDLDIVDLEITLTKELFISLAMDAHLCNISLNEHLVNIIKGEYS